jgi:putative oxidoreductase
MNIRKLFFATADDPALTLARVLLGAVMFAHGAQKALGWFGGYGWDGTMGFFTQQMGIPAIFAALAILAEFLGGLGLITGLLGRVAAFGILSNMVVATVMVHAKVGFFMNWYGAQQGEGYEYHILASTLALLVIWKGSGAWSVDRALAPQA